MTYASDVPAAPALGVSAIVSESLSLLLRNFLSVMLLATVPTLIALAASGLLNGWEVALGISEPIFTGWADLIPFGTTILVQLIAYGITAALLVQLAYDAKLDRPVQVSRYINPALAVALPIAILGLLSGILMVLGIIALIVPGLWIYAVYSVMPAAVAIERSGFSGLGRSARLTKGYRWPIIGATLLIGIMNAVVSAIAMFIVSLFAGGLGTSVAAIAVMTVTLAALSGVGYGLSAISTALIYARLREIKEGVSVRDIAAVFD